MFEHGSWMTGGGIFMFLLWIVLFVLVYLALRTFRASGPSTSARDLLDQRYARGEITKEEYLNRRDDISSR